MILQVSEEGSCPADLLRLSYSYYPVPVHLLLQVNLREQQDFG